MIIDLSPLDSEGIRANRPTHEVRWTRLENVVFKDGALVPRPGFKEAYDFSYQLDATNVEIAPANGLVEIYNPGDTTTGRGGSEWVTETLRPDGSSSVVAGWSASATTLHGDVDEAVPDGTYAYSTTKGARFRLTFANPSATYTDILGVRIYVRARVEYTGVNDAIATLQLDQYSGAAYEIDTFDVWAFDVNETAWWYDYSFLLEKNLADGDAWDDADLDSLAVEIEFVDGSSGIQYTFEPTSIDSNTGWADAVDGGAAAVGDLQLGRETSNTPWPNDLTPPAIWDAAKVGNGLYADTAGDIIELSYTQVPAGVTFTQVDHVQVGWRVTTERYRDCPYEVYYNNGSVDTLIDSGTLGSDCRPYSHPIPVQMTTNPITGLEWTKAEINAASFKLKLTQSVPLTLEYSTVTVKGITNAADVRIDTVYAEVIAPGTTDKPDRLVLSNKSFVRLEESDLTIDNVTNSVASTSLPSLAPYEWAILYGQVYVVNGTDPTKRYPNSSDLFESLTTNNADGATALTGRTVCSFADRILYGWVKDNATYNPETVAYSQQFNGGVHNHASAGQFDIIDSMGGIVALRSLNESLAFCGKEFGIYALRRTGNSAAPIIVDPIDYETSCISRASAKRVLLQGKPVIMFLGSNPSTGMNVFAFDGTTVQPVGDAINPYLEDQANPKTLPMALAGVDPTTNSYVLFFATGWGINRTQAYAMNLNTGAWTSWTMTRGIYSSGIWSIQPTNTIYASLGAESYRGLPTMVLGGEHNLPWQAHSLPYDTLTAPQTSTRTYVVGGSPIELQDGFSFSVDARPSEKDVFTSTMETGDFQLLDENQGEIQLMSYRLHLDYINMGPVRVGVAASNDGGATWTTETISHVGNTSKDGALEHALLDMGSNPIHDRRVRFRIRVVPADSTWELPYAWSFQRIFIEYQPGAIDGA